MRHLLAVVLCLSLVVPNLFGQSFKDVKLVTVQDGKPKETDATVHFLDDRMVVRSTKSGSDLVAIHYSEVKSADYSYSKHPRWKSGAATAAFVGVFAIPLFFMKGKRHWLSVRGEKEFAVLHLDKDNYRVILPAFETKSGKKVDIAPEEK